MRLVSKVAEIKTPSKWPSWRPVDREEGIRKVCLEKGKIGRYSIFIVPLLLHCHLGHSLTLLSSMPPPLN